MHFDEYSATASMYDVTAEGEHFVVVQPLAGGSTSSLMVVENWFDEIQNSP